jgi:hypothetical protein
MDKILNYLTDEEKVQLNGVRGGMFNNRSYWGYKSSVLKSGVCKYYRRGIFDKFEWCVVEMMVMGLVNDGLFTNIINRIKILIMEEIVVNEFEIISRCVKLFEILDDECDDYFKKVKIMKRICEVVKECNKSRMVSYVKNWWKYNELNDDEYKGIKLNKVLKYKKKGDSLELLVLGEKMIEFLSEKDEKIFDVYNKMCKLEKEGCRYRRKDGVYLYIEILEDAFCKDENRKRVFKFVLDRFNKKDMKERYMFGVWFGLMVIYNTEYVKDVKEEIVLDDIENDMVNYLIKDRKYIKINEDFVVNDWHVNRKYGLGKFGKVGSYVENEDLTLLGDNAEKYKEFYILKKEEQEKESIEEEKVEKESVDEKVVEKKVKKNKDFIEEMGIEFVDFDEKYNVVKVIDEGVCGLKKCCIIVENKENGQKYVFKEVGKAFNFGRDYMFVDSLKKMFGLKDMNMKIIKSNKYLVVVDKSIKSFVKNWKFEKGNEVYYCVMDYYDNIGDLGKNKVVLNNDLFVEEMMKIRLFDGLFRSSDNILRNILVLKNGKGLLSIDEGDIYGKRKMIFNSNDWCKKNNWCKKNYGKLIDNWLYGDDKKEIIIEKLKMFGFEDKISEFSERFDNYKDIVMKELS